MPRTPDAVQSSSRAQVAVELVNLGLGGGVIRDFDKHVSAYSVILDTVGHVYYTYIR
jgi:hypothetical protein